MQMKSKKILKKLAILSCASFLVLGSGCDIFDSLLSEIISPISSENTSQEVSSEKTEEQSSEMTSNVSQETSSENSSENSSESSSEISSETSSENSSELSSEISSENSSELSSENSSEKKELKEIYSTGFESNEGYTAATDYQNTTLKLHGPENYQWGITMGTPSTTEPVSGNQSMQMRYYTTKTNIGYLSSQFKFEGATELCFSAKSTGSNGVKVEKSLDGTNWTSAKNYNLTTSKSNLVYAISDEGEDVYIKFTLVLGSSKTNKSRLLIDDIVVNGYGESISTGGNNDQKPDPDVGNPDDGGLSNTDINNIEAVVSTYYASIGNSYTGSTLWSKLNTLTAPNQLTSYGDLRYSKATGKSIGGNLDTDYDENNKNNLIDFYSGLSVKGEWDSGSTWNREHVWCQSHGWWGDVSNSDECAGTDLHHLRPTISSINSSRNNSLYGEVSNRNSHAKYYSLENGTDATSSDSGATLYGYIDASVDPRTDTSTNEGVFEPTDRMKGDVARIIMYMLVRYKNEATPVTNIIYTSSRTANAAYDLLLKWHEADPVSNFEIRRNHETYKIQGNRNPFIDNPSYASAIWG